MRPAILALALCLPAPALAAGPEVGLRGSALLFQVDRGPGILPSGDVEIGWVPDLLSGRVRLSILVGGGGMTFDQEGDDPRIFNRKDDPSPHFTGTIALASVGLSFELAVRILPSTTRFSPYIVWRPRLMRLRTATDLAFEEVDLPEVQEWGWFPTAEGGIGLEIALGPGRLFVEACLGLFPLHNDTAGNAVSLSIVTSIGYRHVFHLKNRDMPGG